MPTPAPIDLSAYILGTWGSGNPIYYPLGPLDENGYYSLFKLYKSKNISVIATFENVMSQPNSYGISNDWSRNYIYKHQQITNDTSINELINGNTSNDVIHLTTLASASGTNFSNWYNYRSSSDPWRIWSITTDDLEQQQNFPSSLEPNTIYIKYDFSMANTISRHTAWGNIYKNFSSNGVNMEELSTYYDVSWTHGTNLQVSRDLSHSDFFPKTSAPYSILTNLVNNNKFTYIHTTPDKYLSFHIIIPKGVVLIFPLGFDRFDGTNNYATGYTESFVPSTPYLNGPSAEIYNITIEGGGIIDGELLYQDQASTMYMSTGLLQLVAKNNVTINNISVINGIGGTNGRGMSPTQINAFNTPVITNSNSKITYRGQATVNISNCEFIMNPSQADGLDSLAGHTYIYNTYIQSHDDNLKLASNITGKDITIFAGGGVLGGAGGAINIGSYGYGISGNIDLSGIYIHNLPTYPGIDTICDNLHNWTGVGAIFSPYVPIPKGVTLSNGDSTNTSNYLTNINIDYLWSSTIRWQDFNNYMENNNGFNIGPIFNGGLVNDNWTGPITNGYIKNLPQDLSNYIQLLKKDITNNDVSFNWNIKFYDSDNSYTLNQFTKNPFNVNIDQALETWGKIYDNSLDASLSNILHGSLIPNTIDICLCPVP